MAKKIKVIYKIPGDIPRESRIANTLKNMQDIVNGYIECVTVYMQDAHGELKRVVIVCNEDGRIDGFSKYNCIVGCFNEHGMPISLDMFGNLIFCGADGEDLSDIPIDYQTFKMDNLNMWEVNHD